ncbi:hypothetical protein N8693_00360 [Verrucomicrobia bacterium]|nr:hypothetical protein [bacterium]MDA7622394.1 hypothetical protein [Verrucomicrobiota bacterium]
MWLLISQLQTVGGFGMPDSILRTQCLPSSKTGATGGTGAEAIAVLTEGRVTSIEMINAGRGYTSEPTITIEPPIVPPTRVSLRMVPAITITGDVRQPKIIEVADTADGPWTVWRTVVIDWDGTTEVDLDEGAEKLDQSAKWRQAAR